MCGINGFNFKDEKLIQKMNGSIKYRGPDDDGFFVNGYFSLGQVRLSILDLSQKASQPMISENGRYIIVYNGEIYNFLELKEELRKKGYKFKSQSDTEVVLNLYQEKKEKCLEKLNGIFSLAILDQKNRSLFLARDRLGVKPLYYFWDKKRFIFSSDMKPILKEKSVFREIDFTALNCYLRFLYVPEEKTFLKQIKKLKAGHFLILKDNKIKIKKYWEINNFKDKFNNFSEAKKAVKQQVEKSVARQLISDRPMGIFLSGGIDSNVILSVISNNNLLGAGRKIKTYSVGFETDAEKEKFNADFNLARQSAKFFGTDHHEILISDKMIYDNFEEVVRKMGEPFSNFTNFSVYFLSQIAKKKVAVVLGGDGGDELFGGYPRYYYSRLISYYQLLPKFFRYFFLDKVGIKLFGNKFKKFSAVGLDKFLAIRMQGNKDIKKILKKDFFNVNAPEEYFAKFFNPPKTDDYEKNFMYIDLATWLIDESLLRTDKMTMAHGLEQRVPLLDYKLVELAFQIPTKFKIKGKNTKYILKESFKNNLPDFIYQAGKRGFFAPGAKWLRRGLKPLAYEILSPAYNKSGQEIFNFNEIKKILDNHINGKKYNLNLILSLMTFQVWQKHLLKDEF